MAKFRYTDEERERYEALSRAITKQRKAYFKRAGYREGSLSNENDYDFVNFVGRKPRAFERIESRKEFVNKMRRMQSNLRTGWNTQEISVFKKNLMNAIEERFGPKGLNYPRQWIDNAKKAVLRAHYNALEKIHTTVTPNLIGFTYFDQIDEVTETLNGLMSGEFDK